MWWTGAVSRRVFDFSRDALTMFQWQGQGEPQGERGEGPPISTRVVGLIPM